MATISLKISKSSPDVTKKKKKKKSTKTPKIKVTTPAGETIKDFKVGNYVCLTDDRKGYIRYVGQTAFSKNILYGIELDDVYEGKHSGTHKGVKYFDTAAPNQGIFVSIKKIASRAEFTKSTTSSHNLGITTPRSKHGRKLSAMIYRGGSINKSRVSFVVPDMSALMLSPTEYDTDDNQSVTSNDSIVIKPGFNSLLDAYSSEMRDSLIINEDEEEKYSQPKESQVIKLRLTPTGKVNIANALRHKIKRIAKKKKGISVRIPFGSLNSKCMSIILRFLTMKEASEYAFVSQSARDSIRLIALYDFRYMLYDALSVQQIRKILCILKFHKPKELILPMAYFIYDPVVLRLFLQFFNVDQIREEHEKQMFKYIHKLVIDDRDIRPSSWLMRPGNYPWNELCNRDNSEDTVFPFELVECFQSLGNNLWELDIRYTMNVELSYFTKSTGSILYLSVSAENRMDIEHFYNVTHLTIQNNKQTWEEIQRTELVDWKASFRHLTHLSLINQRFESSLMDLVSAITWLPCIKSLFMSNCHFNEQTLFEGIPHIKETSNYLNNRLHEFTIKRQTLSKTLFAVVSQFFCRINKLFIIDCKLKKSQSFDFQFFKSMTHLTNITIINLKPKKRIKKVSYGEFLHSIFDKITKYVYVCPVTLECNLIKSAMKISSHILCKYCKQMVERKGINDHLSILCGEKFIECNLCFAKVKRKSLTYHWKNNCKEYYIQCFLCPKQFTVKTRYDFHDHVLRHSMDLDEECGKYEMLFMHHKQAVELTNDYPVYTITNCRNCQCRAIGPVVVTKYREKLIPNQCDSCDIWNPSDNTEKADAKTKSKRISHMKTQRGKKVLPHPFPKTIKLKSIK